MIVEKTFGLLKSKYKNHIIMVIRESLVEKVIAKWNIKPAFVFIIAEKDYMQVSDIITKQCK